MSSGDDLVELEYVETLDDLSNKIRSAREKLDANDSKLKREFSVRHTGLRVGDVLDDEDNHIEDPNQGMKDLLVSFQDLVDTLFAQRKFLTYSNYLDVVVSGLQSIKDQERMRAMQSLVCLMKHTVENHNKHPCTELRYVTLLEIVLSYRKDNKWEPSSNINAQWKRLSCKVEKETDPEEFRRQAYQVLVSLPWVPSSYGLYTACSYDDSEALAPWDELPLCIQSRLEQIPEPLLRSDRVHHILHKLRGKNFFTVLISSPAPEAADNSLVSNSMQTSAGGNGKTTFAALLAAHPAISEKYSVFWVDLLEQRWMETIRDQTDDVSSSAPSLSHSHYMECLKRLCLQLDVEPNWPNFILRLEDSSVKRLREQGHMKVAKQFMAELLQGQSKKVLIVLDGVRDEKDYEWFQFLDGQSTVVVSVNPSVFIPRATFSVNVEELGTDEAIQLFASESSHDRNHAIFKTAEAKAIVAQCMLHPLIVKTVAHWFKMKQVTAGLRKGIEELNLELSMLKHSSAARSDIFKALTEIMNIMLSPSIRNNGEPSKVLKLCLASVAVVFSNTCVPMDAILALWSQLFVKHPDAVAEVSDGLPDSELLKRIWYIAEAFMHLGLFALSEDEGVLMVKLYHPLYVEYGLNIVSELNKNNSVEDVKSVWHGHFVEGNKMCRETILAKKTTEDKCRPYALKRLVYHMIEAKSIPAVLELLRDEDWCRERIFTYGWYEGSKIHVEDCDLLRKRAQASKSASLPETRKVILTCLKKISTILNEETPNLTDESRIEKAMALHLVGFTQAENGGITDALTQYKNAMTLMTQPAHPFNAIITYSQAVLHLFRNDHDKSLKKLKACLKIIKEADSLQQSYSIMLQQEAVQLKGDALLASCDYVGAEESYEEALDLMNEKYPLETTTALYRRGILHYVMGELDQAIAALGECINVKLDIGENCSNGLCHAYCKVGDIFYEFHEKQEALKHFEHALDIAEDLEIEGHEYDLVLLNGKISFLRNDFEGCFQCFERVREMIRKFPRLFMDQSAGDLRLMGKMSIENGKKQDAVEIFRQAIDLTKDRPESLERGSVLFELAHCLQELGNTKEAITCMENSINIRQSKLGSCEMVLDTQVTIGNMYKKMEMHKEYLDVSKEVMYLTEKLYKGDEEKAASAIFGVAEAYEVLDEYDQAVAMYDECKELLKRALCNDHPDVANVLQRLGKLHSHHDEYEKAFECYSMALRICQANFEPNHPQLAETLYSTGIVARKRGDYESARQHLQDALRIQKQLEQTNDTCLSLIELGNVHRLVKEADISIGCYERCLEILKAADGDPSIHSSLYLALGHAKLSLGEIAGATECYEMSLKNRIELYGRDNSETAIASRSMGIIKYLSESFAEARIYLSDFARVMELQNSTINVDFVISQIVLGQIHDSESRQDEAFKCLSKANGVLEQHPTVANKVPGLKDLVVRTIEFYQSKQSNNQEQKSFFSRFADMARLEEETTSEVPIQQRIDEILREHVFLDD